MSSKLLKNGRFGLRGNTFASSSNQSPHSPSTMPRNHLYKFKGIINGKQSLLLPYRYCTNVSCASIIDTATPPTSYQSIDFCKGVIRQRRTLDGTCNTTSVAFHTNGNRNNIDHLEERTKRLLYQLRDEKKEIVHNKKKAGWFMSQIHKILYDWATLSDITDNNDKNNHSSRNLVIVDIGGKNMNNNNVGAMNQIVDSGVAEIRTSSPKEETTGGELLEALLHGVMDISRDLSEWKAPASMTGVEDSLDETDQLQVRPTIQMFSHAIEACIHLSNQSSDNKKSRPENLDRAERILQLLLDFVENDRLNRHHRLLDERIEKWNGDKNERNGDVNSLINSSAALVIHELLKNVDFQSVVEGGGGNGGNSSVNVLEKSSNDLMKEDNNRLDPLNRVGNITHRLDSLHQRFYDEYSQKDLSERKRSIVENQRLEPNTTYINAKIHMLATISNKESMSRAREIVECMLHPKEQEVSKQLELQLKQKYAGNNTINYSRAEPNVVTFNLLLHGYAKLGDADEAESILRWFNYLHQEGQISAKPDRKTFNIVLNSYAKSINVKSGKKDLALQASIKAQHLFSLMESLSLEQEKEEHRMQTNSSGNIVRSREHDQNLSISISNSSSNSLRPDKVSYTALINVFAQCGNATKAHEILNRMMELAEHNDSSDYHPDFVTFSAVLDAYAKSDHPRAVEKCWEIIHLMEELALANSDTSRSQHKYQKQEQQNLGPSTMTFNSLINAIGKHNVKKGRGGNRAQEVLGVLKYMERLDANHSQIMHCKPNASTYNTILSILGRSKRFREVKDLFERITCDDTKDVDVITYNTYLGTLAKVGGDDAAEQALSILHKMKDNSSTAKIVVMPNTRTYNTVMNVLAKSGPKYCNRVENLLNEMETMYNEIKKENKHQGKIAVVPNSISYTTYINAIARSNLTNKAARALNVLHRMEAEYNEGNKDAEPNTLTYNALLNACCFVRNDDKEEVEMALDISDFLKKEMRSKKWSNCDPDHITYGTILKELGRHIRNVPDRVVAVRTEFQQCCADGLVSIFVLKQLKKVIPTNVYTELLESRSQARMNEYSYIPKQWYRNVESRLIPRTNTH